QTAARGLPAGAYTPRPSTRRGDARRRSRQRPAWCPVRRPAHRAGAAPDGVGPRRPAAATPRSVVRFRGPRLRRPCKPVGNRVTELDREQIQALIPHRPPFLLIDRVVEIDPGKRIVGLKEVTLQKDRFLEGHFPNYPVVPGVLIVEALAQTGAVLVMQDAA